MVVFHANERAPVVIIEQVTTDMVQVINLDTGFSHVNFAFETTRPAPEPFFASTEQVRQVLAANPDKPVDALADQRLVRRYLPLNPACTESIFTDVPVQCFYWDNWRAWGGLPKPFADADSDNVSTNTLFSWDQRENLVYSFATGKPVSIAFVAGDYDASARYYDLDALAALLVEHPWIREVGYDSGRPGHYDHVPASLSVVVSLPQDVYEAALAAVSASEHYRSISELLFGAPSRSVKPVGVDADLLGIASAVRNCPYVEPQDEWASGETFGALEKSLPSSSAMLG